MSGTVQPTALDPRLMSVALEVSGVTKTYNEAFWMRAKGCKYANPLQNECTLEIANLTEATRNYILTETSPFNQNKTPKLLSLYAGRASTGLFLVYQGNIMTSGISQPPDIRLSLKCGTLHSLKGKVGSRSGGKGSKLSALAGGIATNLNLSLNMQASDKTISNYSHSGNALDEVSNLHNMGVDAFVDDTQLVIKDVGQPISGNVLNLSEQTGMIGIPEINEQGLRVTFLFNGSVKLGCAIQITSKLNPAANGLFVIFKLNFALASREKEFYYMAECLKAKS